MKDPIFSWIAVILVALFWRILSSIPGIRRELKKEKEEAEELSAMTPEEIKEKSGIDINKKVKILPIVGFIFSFVVFLLIAIFGIYVAMDLEKSILRTIVIILSIAIGFTIFLMGIIKFSKQVDLMRKKELWNIGQKMKKEDYYILTLKKSLLVIIGIFLVGLILWYLNLI